MNESLQSKVATLARAQFAMALTFADGMQRYVLTLTPKGVPAGRYTLDVSFRGKAGGEFNQAAKFKWCRHEMPDRETSIAYIDWSTAYSATMPARLTTGPHLASSACMNAR